MCFISEHKNSPCVEMSLHKNILSWLPDRQYLLSLINYAHSAEK